MLGEIGEEGKKNQVGGWKQLGEKAATGRRAQNKTETKGAGETREGE